MYDKLDGENQLKNTKPEGIADASGGKALQFPESALRDIGLHEKITAISAESSGLQLSGDVLSDDGFYAIDKLEAHIGNVRHVAVSIFVFAEKKLLLQRRAESKYHSAGLWANTVCSHPRWCESVDHCAARRLQEELGLSVPLLPFGSIDYAARVGDLHENEHVRCYYGRFNQVQSVKNFNPSEVSAVKWMSIPEILAAIHAEPASFTEWFKIYMAEYRQMIEAII